MLEAAVELGILIPVANEAVVMAVMVADDRAEDDMLVSLVATSG